jgi:hypothetical protein
MRTKGVLKSISRMPPVGAGILRKGPIRDIENEEQRKQTLESKEMEEGGGNDTKMNKR